MFLMAGLTACSSLDFERSDFSGYADNRDTMSDARDFYRKKRSQERSEAREELGLPQGRELSEDESDTVTTRLNLKEAEKKLRNEQERKQYFTLKPYFRSDNDRIAFLRQPNREAREKWARSHNIRTDENRFDPMTNNMIENNDVGRGMSRTAVKQSWGEPDAVEVAGNSLYGNERWRYSKQVSTEEGYKLETRIIYFEAGRVVGWETLN
jgi:hypothetical protein